MQKQIVLIKVCMMIYGMLTFSYSIAQHQHFMYLQHEQYASFYVKYQGQIYRSSSQGYLILSKIPKGVLTFYIGVVDNGQQELKFVLDSIYSDRGFVIKNFGENGWGLVDLQQTNIVYAIRQPKSEVQSASKIYGDTAINDAFGNMLSEVTKDTTVKYVTIKKPVALSDTMVVSKPAGKLSSDSIVKGASDIKMDATQINPQNPPQKEISLISKEEKRDAVVFVFLVPERKRLDTVVVEIQNQSKLKKVDTLQLPEKNTIKQRELIASNIADTLLALRKNEAVKSDTIVGNIVLKSDTIQQSIDHGKGIGYKHKEMGVDTVKAEVTAVVVPVVADSVYVHPEIVNKNNTYVPLEKKDCKLANEETMIRLRKKMAGKKTEDQMIEEALKGFKQTCYTTLQIGQLSGLIMSDEMRYRFFDMAYKYVADPDQYIFLGKYIQDPYYKKRFEALIPNP